MEQLSVEHVEAWCMEEKRKEREREEAKIEAMV
jgi:hypothetical protein